MDDQNRLRLERMAARHAKRSARNGTESESETDAAFLAAFSRTRDEVLRPVMAEVGAQLKAAGYDFRVSAGNEEGSPSVDFHVVIADRAGSKNTIRLFARKDAERGWQVIGELDLMRSPVELTRFETPEEITRGVAEQLVVDAVEQMFASTSGAPPSEPLPVVPAPSAGLRRAPARPEPPPADAVTPLSTEPPLDVRALAVERLHAGRVLHGLDLVGADLHGLDFTGAQMSGLDLRRANLQGCLLTGAGLTAARLEGADLSDANLTGAILSRADLSHAVLVRARFDGAILVDTIGAPPEPSEQVPVREAEPAAGAAPAQTEETPTLQQLPALALPPLQDAAESRWARWAGDTDGIGRTEEVDISMFRRAALPFTKGAPAPAFFETADAERAEVRPPRAGAKGHETMALPVMDTVIPEGKGGADERRAGENACASLTVEQYAAFCAELEVFPGHVPHVHRRYGIGGPDARMALDSAFARRFGADSTLKQRWRALVAHYADWYRGQAVR